MVERRVVGAAERSGLEKNKGKIAISLHYQSLASLPGLFGGISQSWKRRKEEMHTICAVSVHEGAGSGLVRAMASTNRKDGWGNASVLTRVGILTVINFLGGFLRHWWQDR